MSSWRLPETAEGYSARDELTDLTATFNPLLWRWTLLAPATLNYSVRSHFTQDRRITGPSMAIQSPPMDTRSVVGGGAVYVASGEMSFGQGCGRI